jgi:hypothetical protein
MDNLNIPLPNVLLSLSGSSNYRRNNVTQEGGVLEFTSLVCRLRLLTVKKLVDSARQASDELATIFECVNTEECTTQLAA